MEYNEIVSAELIANGIILCRSCGEYNSHKRGFADRKNRIIHMDAAFATRSTLHGFLHEVGHIVNNSDNMRRFEKEAAAEDYARKSLRTYGIPVSRKVARMADAYIMRFKKMGDKIKAAKNRSSWGN